jgi:hypothetical protein
MEDPCAGSDSDSFHFSSCLARGKRVIGVWRA